MKCVCNSQLSLHCHQYKCDLSFELGIHFAFVCLLVIVQFLQNTEAVCTEILHCSNMFLCVTWPPVVSVFVCVCVCVSRCLCVCVCVCVHIYNSAYCMQLCIHPTCY